MFTETQNSYLRYFGPRNPNLDEPSLMRPPAPFDVATHSWICAGGISKKREWVEGESGVAMQGVAGAQGEETTSPHPLLRICRFF